MKLRRICCAIAVALATQASAADMFRFTAIPDQNTARLKERFDRVAVYLSGELGIDVEYIPVKSYAASVNAFKNDEVQLAWFGGLSGVKARRSVAGSQAIAQGEEDLEFVTYFIANASHRHRAVRRVPRGDSGPHLHLRFQGVDVGPPDAGVLHQGAFQEIPGRGLQTSRLQRRPLQDPRPRAVGQLRGRGPQLQGVRQGESRGQRRLDQGERNLAHPDLPGLQLVDPRRRRGEVRRGVHRQGKGRPAVARRPRDPRPVPAHPASSPRTTRCTRPFSRPGPPSASSRNEPGPSRWRSS